MMQKTGFLGKEKVIYLEKEELNGEHSYIHGEWVWFRK